MELLTRVVLGLLLTVSVNIRFTTGISAEKDLSLSSKEKNALDKFRDRVMPLLADRESWLSQDLSLIRWLRARNFNLDAAEAMLKTNLQWRKENKINETLIEDWTDFRKEFPATMDSFDKEGRPLGTIDIYEWDIRKNILQGRGQKLLRYMYYLMEHEIMRIYEQQASNKTVTQWVTLGNAADFNLVQHGCPLCIPVWIQFIQNLENNYPGWLDQFIIVDSPSTISIVLEAVRPFLTPQTREAFRIFGPNRSKWMPYLDEKIDRSERRPQYGGSKPQPNF